MKPFDEYYVITPINFGNFQMPDDSITNEIMKELMKYFQQFPEQTPGRDPKMENYNPNHSV